MWAHSCRLTRTSGAVQTFILSCLFPLPLSASPARARRPPARSLVFLSCRSYNGTRHNLSVSVQRKTQRDSSRMNSCAVDDGSLMQRNSAKKRLDSLVVVVVVALFSPLLYFERNSEVEDSYVTPFNRHPQLQHARQKKWMMK